MRGDGVSRSRLPLIDLRVWRDLRGIPTHVAAIVVALGVAMAMPSGLELALRSLGATRDAFTSELHLADLEIRMLPEDLRNLPDWKGIDGIAGVESRLLVPGTIEVAGGRTIAALTVFQASPEPQINQLRLLEGSTFSPGATEEAVVERSAAAYGGLRVGQTIRVTVGKKEYRHHLTGIAASPEYLIVAANPEYFLPEKGSLAVVFTSLDRIYEGLGFEMVNDLIFTFEPGHDPAKLQAEILGRLQGRTLERVIPRDQHLSRRHIEIDQEVFRIFEPAIGLVLGLMAAALVIINVDRIVRRQRREIGAMLALGYRPFRVGAAYLLGALGLAGGGILVGTAGALAFRSAFLAIYARAHGLAQVDAHADPRVLLGGASAVLAVAAVSTLVATRVLWRATPRALMRPAPPRIGTAFANLGRVAARGPLAVRIAIRNAVRHLGLTATTVVTVGLALSVGVAYLVNLESMGAAIDGSFANQRWDRTVSFLYPTLDEEYAEIGRWEGVEAVEPFVRAQGQIVAATQTRDTSVLGLQPQGSMRTIALREGRLARAAGEIVIGEDLARRLVLGLGSEVELQLRNRRHRVSVVGIKSDVLLGESLVSLQWARELLELEDQATGAFVAFEASADDAKLDASLVRLDFAARLTRRDQLVSEFRTIIEDIRKLVTLVAFIALAVAALFVAVGLTMTASERAGEIATLRALGYGPRFVAQVVLSESATNLFLALLLVAPASWAIAEYLNGLASKAWFSQPTVYPSILYGVVAIAAVVVALGATIPAVRGLQQMNIVQALRSRQIE